MRHKPTTIQDKRKALIDALANNNFNELVWAIQAGADNFDNALSWAVKGGHEDKLQLLLAAASKTNGLNQAMADAAYNGDLDNVLLLLELGAEDYDWAMEQAAIGGYVGIVELMLEMGATDYQRALAWPVYSDIEELIIRYASGKGKNPIA